jgi:two-component system CheB/CheR fusion protein
MNLQPMEIATQFLPTVQNEKGLIPSTLDFPVVGIGASAGGLQALLRLFENMPNNNGMAFVIVLHLSPKHESTADSVLQRATSMPVKQVSQLVHIEKITSM